MGKLGHLIMDLDLSSPMKFWLIQSSSIKLMTLWASGILLYLLTEILMAWATEAKCLAMMDQEMMLELFSPFLKTIQFKVKV